MKNKIDEILKNTLRIGEKVLWESGTQRFRLFDGVEGRATLAKWLIGGICYIIAIGLFAFDKGVTTRMVVAFSLILAFAVIVPLHSFKALLVQRYYVTTQRAIMISKNGAVFTMERKNIDAIRIYPVRPGAAIVLGKSIVSEQDKQLRWRSVHAMHDPNSEDVRDCIGLVFYNVEFAERAVRLLEEPVDTDSQM